MNGDSNLDEVLAALQSATPDSARSARVRDACKRKLTRPPARRTVETAVVGGFCAIYVGALVLNALRVHGLI